MNQVYILKLTDENLSSAIDELLPLVGQEKSDRISKFKFAADKKLSLYSDLLVRTLASQKLGVPNCALVFSKNEFGKPHLADYPDFKYNISHTRNAIAVGISEKEMGIDIEKLRSTDSAIAKRFFTADETEYIFYHEQKTDKRFYEIWTKKEAYIKWVGKGLSLPLGSFSVFDVAPALISSTYNEYILSVCS